MMSPLPNRSVVLVISPLMINESGKCSAYLYDLQLSQGSDTELGIFITNQSREKFSICARGILRNTETGCRRYKLLHSASIS